MKLGVDGTKGHKYRGIALLTVAFKIDIPLRSLIPSTFPDRRKLIFTAYDIGAYSVFTNSSISGRPHTLLLSLFRMANN